MTVSKWDLIFVGPMWIHVTYTLELWMGKKEVFLPQLQPSPHWSRSADSLAIPGCAHMRAGRANLGAGKVFLRI